MVADGEQSALGFMLIKDVNPFKTSTDWQSPDMASLDRSVYDMLKERGTSEQALRLIDHTANNNGIKNASIFNQCRSQYLWKPGQQSDVITNGTPRLPEAMASTLADKISLNTQVKTLNADHKGVNITTKDNRTYRSDFCKSTIPLPAYRSIKSNVAYPDLFKEAISGNHYTNITHLFIDTEPFWEEDGLPVMMWSDGPLEHFFPRIAPNGEIVGYKIWLNGVGAQFADKQNMSDLQNLVRKELKRIRPASFGKANIAKVMSWQKEPNYHGAYMHWPAGKTAAMSNAVRAPIGRFLFSGEHCSIIQPGLEGAFESGAKAAQFILDQAL